MRCFHQLSQILHTEFERFGLTTLEPFDLWRFGLSSFDLMSYFACVVNNRKGKSDQAIAFYQ